MLSEYSNHTPQMVGAHDHQTAKLEIAQAVYNYGARGIDIGIRAAFLSSDTVDHERTEIGYQKRMAENCPNDSWVALAKWRINRRAMTDAGEVIVAGPKAVF